VVSSELPRVEGRFGYRDQKDQRQKSFLPKWKSSLQRTRLMSPIGRTRDLRKSRRLASFPSFLPLFSEEAVSLEAEERYVVAVVVVVHHALEETLLSERQRVPCFLTVMFRS